MWLRMVHKVMGVEERGTQERSEFRNEIAGIRGAPGKQSKPRNMSVGRREKGEVKDLKTISVSAKIMHKSEG